MIKKAQSGMALKAKAKSVVKKKMQTPADFEPKSKFPRTPGGGDNYDETIKRERDLKAKGMMKMGGKVKKKMQMGGSAESNKFSITSKNKISIPKKTSKDSSVESNKFTIPSRNKITIPRMDKYEDGGALKPVPAGKKGLAKLPTDVRHKMGFQKNGGTTKKCKYGCK